METGVYLFAWGIWLYAMSPKAYRAGDPVGATVVSTLATLAMLRAGWLFYTGFLAMKAGL